MRTAVGGFLAVKNKIKVYLVVTTTKQKEKEIEEVIDEWRCECGYKNWGPALTSFSFFVFN